MKIINAALALIIVGQSFSVAWAARQPSFSRLLTNASAATQTQWAARYEHGEGVSRNYTRAIRLYCKAAQKGHTEAQYSLGWLYANGRGVRRDDALAAAWFRKAAQKDHAQAKRMLALVDNPKKRKRAICKSYGGGGGRLAKVSAAERRKIAGWVRNLAPSYGLDPKLVLAVIEVESGFDVKARSPKNAMGLMQLIRSTATRFGVNDPYDPQQNLRGGMAYLRWLLDYFKGDLKRALAGYNAGENAVIKYQGIPPFAETQAYVARIIRRYGHTTHPALSRKHRDTHLVSQ